MIKGVVFFDLDGTLMNKNNKISTSNLVAIKRLKARNILPVIATGRNKSMIIPLMKRTGINNAVCDNGCHLIFHGKSIFQDSIPMSTLDLLVKKSNERHNPLAYQTSNQIAFSSKKRVPKASIKRYDNAPVKPNFYKNHHIIFISLFTNNPKNDRYYQKTFKNKLSIVRNCAVCLDVTNIGVDKGSGVQKMLHKLHLINVPSFCFGNGLNDIPMFKAVKHPIAMKDSNECKEYAQYITDDCNHNGITKGLKHFNLI